MNHMESNIRKLRKKQGLSQKQLGEQIGVSQQVVSRMEREREVISVDVLLQLASFFKVSTDNILGFCEPDEKINNWMQGMNPGNIRKGDVITLIEQTNNLRSKEWAYVWFLINVMRN